MKKILTVIGAVGMFTLFSFYSNDKVEGTSATTSEYPEIEAYTYYEDYETSYEEVVGQLDEASSLTESTGDVHGFAVTSSGGTYGLGNVVNTGADPDAGFRFHHGGLSAQFENWLSVDPCAWLNAFTGNLYNYDPEDC